MGDMVMCFVGAAVVYVLLSGLIRDIVGDMIKEYHNE